MVKTKECLEVITQLYFNNRYSYCGSYLLYRFVKTIHYSVIGKIVNVAI